MVPIENDINNAYNFSDHPVVCHRAWSITAVCMLLPYPSVMYYYPGSYDPLQ